MRQIICAPDTTQPVDTIDRNATVLDSQPASTIGRRALLARLATSIVAAPVLAGPVRAEAQTPMPQTERLRALDVEFAAAFERADAIPYDAPDGERLPAILHVVDLADGFREAASELWASDPRSLDDLCARAVCSFHFGRHPMRGVRVSMGSPPPDLIDLAHVELAVAMLGMADRLRLELPSKRVEG